MNPVLRPTLKFYIGLERHLALQAAAAAADFFPLSALHHNPAFFQPLLDLSKHTEQVCSITQHFIITSIGVCGSPVNRSTLFIDWSAKPTNKQTKKKEKKKKGLSPLLHLTLKYLTSAILSAESGGLGVLDC